MKTPHWQYFGVLSDDLERTERYVAIVQDNFKTYSIEFVRILLSVGSEVDVVAKLLCLSLDSASSADKIPDYCRSILKLYPELPDVEVNLANREITICPWAGWKPDASPLWWKGYNNVKHKRDKCFREANLENSINALAGLLVLLGYLYAEELSRAQLLPDRIFRFDRKYWHGSRLHAPQGYADVFCLPGVPKPKRNSQGLIQV